MVDGELVEEDAPSRFNDGRPVARHEEAQRTFGYAQPHGCLAERED